MHVGSRATVSTNNIHRSGAACWDFLTSHSVKELIVLPSKWMDPLRKWWGEKKDLRLGEYVTQENSDALESNSLLEEEIETADRSSSPGSSPRASSANSRLDNYWGVWEEVFSENAADVRRLVINRFQHHIIVSCMCGNQFLYRKLSSMNYSSSSNL